jgi:hypothetical protein
MTYKNTYTDFMLFLSTKKKFGGDSRDIFPMTFLNVLQHSSFIPNLQPKQMEPNSKDVNIPPFPLFLSELAVGQ